MVKGLTKNEVKPSVDQIRQIICVTVLSLTNDFASLNTILYVGICGGTDYYLEIVVVCMFAKYTCFQRARFC